MSNDVTVAQVQGYNAGIRMLQQQGESRLRRLVRSERQEGKKQKFDQIAKIELLDKVSRHDDIQTVEHDHRGRWVTTKTKEARDFVDRSDLVRILNNPVNSYSQSFAKAANRSIDSTVVAAAFATATTGEDGDGTASFDTTNFQIAAGGVGLTVGKLRTARQTLDSYENSGPYAIAVKAKQINNLLGDPEVTSADFNSVKALVNGEINTYMGFEFVRTELIGDDGTNDRVIAWSRPSMLVSFGIEPQGSIDWIPEKAAWQVSYMLDVGATRMDEEGVVEILCA